MPETDSGFAEELSKYSDPELLRKLMRSICLDGIDQKIPAIDNYRLTNVGLLQLTGVAKEFHERVRGALAAGGSPPTWRFVEERATRFGEIELASYARELGTETFYFGSDYITILKDYIERMGGEFLASTLNTSLQILREGWKPSDKDELKKGVFDAMGFVQRETARIQRDLQFQRYSYNREEAGTYLNTEYIKMVNNPGGSDGILTNILPLDQATHGGKKGELWTIAGFTGHGKSTIALNWALQAAMFQNMNVYFYTLEMDIGQAWKIIGSAYANYDSKWGHRERVILYERIKQGTLSREESLFYLNRILPDLRSNPLYGDIIIEKPESRPTISEVWAKAEAQHQARGVDMVVIDYVSLLAPEGRSRDRKDALADNFVAAKHMAMEFDRGKGVLVVTPHQINRKGYATAVQNNGIYEMDSLADSSEVERSSDVVYCTYQDKALRQTWEAVITHLKNRDGIILDPFNIKMDQRTRSVGFQGGKREVSDLENLDA